MAYAFDSALAWKKAFDDDVVFDEINYITKKIIDASQDMKRKVTIAGNTRMTGRSVRADFSGIADAKEIANITPNAQYILTITLNNHGFEAGDHIMIVDNSSISNINNAIFKIGSVTTNTFNIYWKYSIANSGSKNVTNIVATNDTLTVTVSGHGYSMGDSVELSGFTDNNPDTLVSSEINGIKTIATVNPPNTFTISGSFTSFSSGSPGTATVRLNLDSETGSVFKVNLTDGKITYPTNDTDADQYYKTWKNEDVADTHDASTLQRQMDAVVNHFQNQGYQILRKPNDDSKESNKVTRFQWEITW